MGSIVYTALRELVNDTAGFVALMSDLGLGRVDTRLHSGLGVATFTRATTAAARLVNGDWNLAVASGIPRAHYLPDLTYGGYLSEGAATQLITPSAAVRDMTNAAWVKANMNAVKTETGIDGVALSASRLTATGANGTALFTLTAAASSRTYSCFIKRVTGSGSVQITQNNGGAWTTVSLPLAGFNLVQLNASQLNAVFGIRLVTSGDAIAVDCNQFEAGTFATTPIPSAGTRNADQLTYQFSGNASAAAGSAYVEQATDRPSGLTSGDFTVLHFGVGTGLLVPTGSADTEFRINDGTNSVTKTGLTTTADASRKRAASWGAGGLVVTGDNLTVATGSFDGDIGSTSIAVGYRASSNDNYLFGCLKNVRIYGTQVANSLLQSMTTFGTDYARIPGTSVTLDFYSEESERSVSVIGVKQQPKGGGPAETLIDRRDVKIKVTALGSTGVDLIAKVDLPKWREFLASCEGEEQFTFDRYGFAAAVDDPKPAVLDSNSYDEMRMATDQFKIGFTVRMV